MRKTPFVAVIVLLLVSVACSLTGTGQATPKAASPTEMTLPTIASVLETAAVLPTAVPPTATVAPVPTAAGALLDYTSAAYVDDRSTPASLVLSYANAINRHEYLRAYAYWSDPGSYLGTLDNFSTLFASVNGVQVVFGQVTSEGAAGSLYFTVPTVLSYVKSGTTDRYAACFLLRLPQPGNYGAPPITPLHIERGITELLPAGTSDADGLASACISPDYAVSGLPGSTAAIEALSDLSAANYVDNRSGAIEVVSSLINAINHKEYVRAYSYWENPAVTPGDYNSYAAGFADTQSITATFGQVTSDAGAGQWHYLVPVAEVVQTTSATVKTYVGCYTLHLANPGMQATLPFAPLAITQGHFSLVSNGSDLPALLTTACN